MTTLYDASGRKINITKLTKAIAEPVADTFARNVFAMGSSARGLTPERLAAILSEADQTGNGLAYLTLAEEMEQLDPHYRSVLGTRKMAVTGLPTTVEAATDDANDVKMADFITEVTQTAEYDELLEDLVDAYGKGFSVCEIMWDRSGAQWVPSQYKWRDPRFFRFDATVGEEVLLVDEIDPSKTYPLEAYKFIVHRPRLKSGLTLKGGLARAACGIFMWKSFSLRDWASFGERFGMPLRLGKYPKNTAPEDVAKLFQAVAQMGMDSAAVISDTMSVEFADMAGGSGGETLFLARCEWLDKQCSKLVLGQTMTSDDGSSLAQAKVHNQVRSDILASDIKQLNRTLNRQLVKPLIDLNYGPQKAYPRMQLQLLEPEDLDALAKRTAIAMSLGARIEQSYLADKLGYPLADAGADLLHVQAKVMAPGFGGTGADSLPTPEAGSGNG